MHTRDWDRACDLVQVQPIGTSSAAPGSDPP